MLANYIQGWGLPLSALALIAAVFLRAWFELRAELRYLQTLTELLGNDLVRSSTDESSVSDLAQSLETDGIRDEFVAIRNAKDPAWANKQVRGWLMRVQRVEPALAFWIDFLRQLGLLFTVLGLGLSFTFGQEEVRQLLQPLSLAVWTTVAGLALSIWLSAQFSMKIAAWADTCEKNIEAWDERRRQSLNAQRQEEGGTR